MCSCPKQPSNNRLLKPRFQRSSASGGKKKVILLSIAACDNVTFHSSKYHIHAPRGDLVSGKQYQVT